MDVNKMMYFTEIKFDEIAVLRISFQRVSLLTRK